MSLEILENKENPLLGRQEVSLLIKHYGKPTPNKVDLLKEAAGKLGTDESLLTIKGVFTGKGNSTSKVKVFVYKKKEDMPVDNLFKKKVDQKSKEKEAPKPAEKKQ